MCTRFIFAEHVYLYFIPFYGSIAYLSMDIPTFYLFNSWWTFELFPSVVYYELYMNKFLCEHIFSLWGFTLGKGITVLYINYLTFWRIVRLFSEVTVPSLLSYQHSMKCMCSVSLYPHQHLFALFFFLSFSYPCIYEEVSYYGAHLHFPNDEDADYLSVCLLATCMSSLGNIYSNPRWLLKH